MKLRLQIADCRLQIARPRGRGQETGPSNLGQARGVLCAVLCALAMGAGGGVSAAQGGRDAHVAYVYPAGGRQGTTVQVIAGGQAINNAAGVYVSGEGVHASITYAIRPLSNVQLKELQERVRAMQQQRWPGFGGRRGGTPPAFPGTQPKLTFPNTQPATGGTQANASFPNTPAAAPGAQASAAFPNKPVTPPAAGGANGSITGATLPDIPVLRDLEKKSPQDLLKLLRELAEALYKQRTNPQMAETVHITVTIDPDAAPGEREIRLATPGGLTNPMRFEVGRLPEVVEPEPVGLPGQKGVPGPKRGARLAAALAGQQEKELPPVAPPVVLNGQILQGDVDYYRIRARAGQHLVLRAEARSLLPYLADAVPGWFQAVLSLRDGKGREVAYSDDYRFDPDPVLYYEVPADGEYRLEVRDSIYRGRDDFVYRVTVAEQPFITRLYPLGARAGSTVSAAIAGWNLTEKRLALDTKPGTSTIRQAELRGPDGLSNEVSYAVDALPECDEAEPNDTVKNAQRVTLPVVINGIISRPGDTDVFRFDGRAGQQVVAEVLARRLGSPLDSLLRLTDAAGRVIAWNDDYDDPEDGLQTHHADSYISTKLPKDGVYFVRLSDSQDHGDLSYGYRLRISPPQPDFALRATPSSLNVPAGGATLVTVTAVRKDGFDGDIVVGLKGAPFGFSLSGGRIPRGRDSVRMTLSAPIGRLDKPVPLHLEGRAIIGGVVVVRPAVPAEDMMQAFAYRHLVPVQELLVAGMGFARRGAPLTVAARGPVQIPAGGTAQATIALPMRFGMQNARMELSDPPKGITLQDVKHGMGSLTLVLKADAAAVKPGFADNLIVEAYTEFKPPADAPKAANRVRRVSLGVLPAIPFEIVQR